MMFLTVKHNIEVAHRLFNTEGKCEQIHGHSMWVTMHLQGELGPNGIMVDGSGQELEFGAIKKDYRRHLDTNYDHRLLLNASDPFSRPIFTFDKLPERDADFPDYEPVMVEIEDPGRQTFLPGLASTPGDPSTENIARWIGEAMIGYGYPVQAIEVQETKVNGAMWMPSPVSMIDENTVSVVKELIEDGRV